VLLHSLDVEVMVCIIINIFHRYSFFWCSKSADCQDTQCQWIWSQHNWYAWI